MSDSSEHASELPAARPAATVVVARDGARGLTHRSVDREAGTPIGTASNYFGSRDDLIAALVTRIAERLAPDVDLADAAHRAPSISKA